MRGGNVRQGGDLWWPEIGQHVFDLFDIEMSFSIGVEELVEQGISKARE